MTQPNARRDGSEVFRTAAIEGAACNLSAIPVDQRGAHVELVRTLLFGDPSGVQDLEDGYAFQLPADRLLDAARFVDNERRCCAHLTFALELLPAARTLTLRITGPLAREELGALTGEGGAAAMQR